MLLERHGRAGLSLGQLIEAWAGFVADCEEGYSFCKSEFENDIQIRKMIQILLEDSELRTTYLLDHFRQMISASDQQFLQLIQNPEIRNDEDEWWRAAVLKEAGRSYCTDLEGHGFKVLVKK